MAWQLMKFKKEFGREVAAVQTRRMFNYSRVKTETWQSSWEYPFWTLPQSCKPYFGIHTLLYLSAFNYIRLTSQNVMCFVEWGSSTCKMSPSWKGVVLKFCFSVSCMLLVIDQRLGHLFIYHEICIWNITPF